MSKQKDFEEKAFEALQRLRKVTKMGAAKKDWNLNEHPNIDVYDYSPNLRLDGNNRYKIAGREWAIILQVSLLQAIHDILGNRLGYTIDFEEWFKDFEYEFYKALPPGKQPPESKLKPWGKDVKNRPKKLNLLDKKKVAEKGYQIIRFWPDREAEDSSFLLAGTYNELRVEMIDIMRVKKVDAEVYGIPVTSYQESVKFMPQIFLYFLEDPEDVEPEYNAVDGRITFRVKNETPESITEVNAKILAEKIKTEFATNKGYVWKKGKTLCSYTDKENGYKLQLNCRSEGEGQELITKLLSIQSVQFEPEKMNIRDNKAPGTAYPTVPPSKIIYGKEVKLPRRMPIADVRFRRAELHIWGRPKPVILIDLSGVNRNALVKADN